MRGFPLLNALAVLAGMALLWFPLSRLTGRDRGMPAPSSTAETVVGDAPIPIVLRLRFAHPPLRASVSHLGALLWESDDPDAMEAGFESALAIPPEGIDLALDADWPEDTPETALQLEVEPEALESRTAVVWGRGSLHEILTFVWQQDQGDHEGHDHP